MNNLEKRLEDMEEAVIIQAEAMMELMDKLTDVLPGMLPHVTKIVDVWVKDLEALL